jgi:hypothetical protein
VPVWLGAVIVGVSGALPVGARLRCRTARRYCRWQLLPYRTDTASASKLVDLMELLHQRARRRWWRRLIRGQPSIGLEVHLLPTPERALQATLALTSAQGDEGQLLAALRTAYPNVRLQRFPVALGSPPCVLRLKKHATFIQRLRIAEDDEPPQLVDRLLVAMNAIGAPCLVQFALTPAPAVFDGYARVLFRGREKRLSRDEQNGKLVARSEVERAELRGGLSVQHRGLFFTDIRVVAQDRRNCEAIGAELRAAGAENRLVERGTAIRQLLGRPYDQRIARGEGNPIPSWSRGVLASTELAALWHLPTVGFNAVPFERAPVPLSPAPPTVLRRKAGRGCCATRWARWRSIRSCAARTPRCRERLSRARLPTWWRRFARTSRARTAR